MKNSLNNPIKLTVRKSIPAKTNKTVLIPTTLDEEVACFLDEFLGKKIKKTKYLKPLRNMLDEECVTYAKLKKLKFKKTKKQTKATKFLDKLEKISPGSRFALLRSMDKIHSN
ncbi:MAG: hypothetical protein GY861_07200 [bacterium]|nr:hypothetical protein [bacterium]